MVLTTSLILYELPPYVFETRKRGTFPWREPTAKIVSSSEGPCSPNLIQPDHVKPALVELVNAVASVSGVVEPSTLAVCSNVELAASS